MVQPKKVIKSARDKDLTINKDWVSIPLGVLEKTGINVENRVIFYVDREDSDKGKTCFYIVATPNQEPDSYKMNVHKNSKVRNGFATSRIKSTQLKRLGVKFGSYKYGGVQDFEGTKYHLFTLKK